MDFLKAPIYTSNFIKTNPVLATSNMKWDIAWYKEKLGFKCVGGDDMYATLKRDIHLQWHADSEEDRLLGCSVVIFWMQDMKSLFEEYVKVRTLAKDKLRLNTA
jgi:hypothetical protein